MILKAKNKEGTEVEYSFQLAREFLSIHGINISDIIENIYGTRIDVNKGNVIKSYIDSSAIIEFTLTTNDSRDSPLYWTTNVKENGVWC